MQRTSETLYGVLNMVYRIRGACLESFMLIRLGERLTILSCKYTNTETCSSRCNNTMNKVPSL